MKTRIIDLVYVRCTGAIFETVHKHVRAAAKDEKTIGQFLAGHQITNTIFVTLDLIRRQTYIDENGGRYWGTLI